MAGVDKVFGAILVTAGVLIAVYYTIWQVLSLVSNSDELQSNPHVLILQPILSRKHPIYDYFLDPYYLFKLPAAALIVGLLGIDWFISRTNKKVAEEKARKAAAEAAKKKGN